MVAQGFVAAQGPAEQANGLVNQMRAQIVEQATAGLGLFLEFLDVQGRLVPVEAHVYFNELAQLPAGHHALHGGKVTVPAAVLVGQQVAVRVPGQVRQLLPLGDRGGHGFFKQHVLARAQGLSGQLEVRAAGRVHHHQLQGGVGQQLGHA